MCKVKQCEHCRCMNPKLRIDSHNKIFQSLSKAAAKHNAGAQLHLVSATVGRDDDSEDTVISSSEDDGDSSSDSSDEEQDPAKTSQPDKYVHAGEVQAQLQRMWELDPYLCNALVGVPSFDSNGYQRFFIQAVPVPPSRFRPAMTLNNMSVEHSQTQYLSKMIQLNELIQDRLVASSSDEQAKAFTAWIDLQTTVNSFMDSSLDPSALRPAPGIKQLLERKEGLFRKNMMGKRVDYACRSVISPDPYIGTNEIGLPQYFATVLTYPTPVTDWNVKELRQLVERGVKEYPGARWVEMGGKRLDLSKMNRHKREAVAAKLLTQLKQGVPTIVGRHLRDGDFVLMNRQVSSVWMPTVRSRASSNEDSPVMHHSETRNDGL